MNPNTCIDVPGREVRSHQSGEPRALKSAAACQSAPNMGEAGATESGWGTASGECHNTKN